MAWQPIETAPKDGFCLTYSKEFGVMIAKHFDGRQWECVGHEVCCLDYHNPSHWAPLPPPPPSSDTTT